MTLTTWKIGKLQPLNVNLVAIHLNCVYAILSIATQENMFFSWYKHGVKLARYR
jgi:hypothetical protein